MKYLATLFIISITISATAQNAYNEEGLRTGPWKGYYPDSTLRYEVNFEQGKPMGMMKRYNEDGILSATMTYYPNSDRCFAKLYSISGKVKAKGVYESQKKDSTWNYFSNDGSSRMVENYKMGNLSGVSENFYPSGKISRRLSFASDKKNGELLKFFESGNTMMIAHYKDNQLHGEFYSFYPNGDQQISGKYFKDIKDGNWTYSSEEDDSVTVLIYDQGTILNPEVLEKSYENFIMNIEENINNIPDPAAGDRF